MARAGLPPQTQFRQLLRRITTRSGVLVFHPTADLVSPHQTDPRSEWINKFLPNGVAGKTILDIGCWTGVTLRDMKRMGAVRCVGMDIDGPWLTEARRAFPQGEILAIPNINEIPPSFSNTFDILLLLETLEHLPKGTEVTTLRKLRSLLKPSGIAIISTPASGLSRIVDPAWILAGHRHYSSRRLTQLLHTAGFYIEYTGYSGSTKDAISIILHYAKKYLFTNQLSKQHMLSPQHFEVLTKRPLLAQSIWISTRARYPAS